MPKKDINLKLIIQGCRRGNRNSQRVLFAHYLGYAMNICLRYAKNREEAEEMLNDGFLKVFRKINQYDDSYDFRNWLHKVMTNAAIDYFRANQHKIAFVELSPAIDFEGASAPLPEILPGEDLLPVLQELSPAYRMVFNLAVIEDYKHEEIANMLGISANTSRSNLARAKDKLRKLFAKKNKPANTMVSKR